MFNILKSKQKTYSFLHFSAIGAAHVVLNCFLESLSTEKQIQIQYVQIAANKE